MRISIKLLILTLILTAQSASIFAMDDLTEVEQLAIVMCISFFDEQDSTINSHQSSSESKIDTEMKIKDEDSKINEDSGTKLKNINKYQNECLKQYLPNTLCDLVQQYNPWVLEIEIKCNNPKTICTSSTILSLCLLPENKFASGDANGIIKIWNSQTGECEKEFPTCIGSIYSIHALPNNQFESKLKNRDKFVKITGNWKTGKLKSLIEGYEDEDINDVSSLSLIPLSNITSTYNPEDALKIINLLNYIHEKGSEKNADFKNIVNASCLLPEKKLASGHEDGTIKIWNWQTGICEIELENDKDEDGPVRSLCLLQGNKLAAGYSCGTIKIWRNELNSSTKELENIEEINASTSFCVIQ